MNQTIGSPKNQVAIMKGQLVKILPHEIKFTCFDSQNLIGEVLKVQRVIKYKFERIFVIRGIAFREHEIKMI